MNKILSLEDKKYLDKLKRNLIVGKISGIVFICLAIMIWLSFLIHPLGVFAPFCSRDLITKIAENNNYLNSLEPHSELEKQLLTSAKLYFSLVIQLAFAAVKIFAILAPGSLLLVGVFRLTLVFRTKRLLNLIE